MVQAALRSGEIHNGAGIGASSTVLFLAANPVQTPRLQLDEECRAIEDKLQRARFRDQIKFRSWWAARPMDLMQVLNEDAPSILHFSGHGMGNQGLCFQAHDGHAVSVSTDLLERMIREAGNSIMVVVLNACYSEAQAQVLISHIPCVIGMPRPIADKTAIIYAESFYGAISSGRSVGNAHRQGLIALELRHHGEAPRDLSPTEHIAHQSNPRLFTKLGVDADSVHVVVRARRRFSLVIRASIETMDAHALARITEELQQISQDLSLQIEDIKEGSVKLTISSSSAAFEKLLALRSGGGLQHVGNYAISDIRELADESMSDNSEWELTTPGRNPYRGLLSFERQHSRMFFGRSREIGAIIERLRTEPFVVVAGESGVGKSSLCRAGVVPAVTDGALGNDRAWRAITIVPGARPLAALCAALGDPQLADLALADPGLLSRELAYRGGRELAYRDGRDGLVLFIDQLEELVTVGNPAESSALAAALARIIKEIKEIKEIKGIRVIATVRAEFLPQVSALQQFGRELERALYFLLPLSPAQVREVIIEPAAATDVSFESDAMVGELVAATVQAGNGGLSLLQVTLAKLWDARDPAAAMIRAVSLTALGGITGALTRHADCLLAGLRASERDAARRILLRLVTTERTRARRSKAELIGDGTDGGAERSALEVLVQGEVLVNNAHDDAYEIAHEALLSGWPTLRQWLDADSAERTIRDRLSAAAAQWVRLGRRSDAIWQVERLEEAAALDPESLGADDRAFLAASRLFSRRRRWQRWFVGLVAVALVALAFFTQRYLQRRTLDAEVADRIAAARRELHAARAADAAMTGLEARANALFDAVRWPEGEDVWGQGLVQRELAGRAYRRATSEVEVALAKDPTRSEVRDLIGDILLARALLAEHVRDVRERADLIERLALYDDDGSRRAQWNAPGRVVVRAPGGAEITLDESRRLGSGSASTELASGSYTLSIALPGRVAVHAPILIERGKQLVVAIALPPRIEDMPQGFVYIPPGEFLYGNASEDDRRNFFSTTPLRRRSTRAFLIQRTEVTFEDWLRYVDSLAPAERAQQIPAVLSKLSGSLAVTPDGAGHWRIAFQPEGQRYTAGWDEPVRYLGRDHQAMQRWQRFPVLGVSGQDAATYAAWLDRTGQVRGARVCSEVEWERAGRGADGRPYPSGRSIDPGDLNVDITHGFGHLGPDEVGAHPGSRSPFGIEDMSGNAFEWTLSETGGFILRGGSYQHDLKTAQLTNRASMSAAVRDAALGVRLCADPPLSH